MSNIVPCFRNEGHQYDISAGFRDLLERGHVDSPYAKKDVGINRKMEELDKEMKEGGCKTRFTHPRFADRCSLFFFSQGTGEHHIGALTLVSQGWGCKELEALLSQCKDKKSLFESGDAEGQTLLFCALKNCYRERTSLSLQKLQLLLQEDVDPNIADVHGHTPLYLAAEKSDKEMCKRLFAHGAQVGKNWPAKMQKDLEKIREAQTAATVAALVEITGLPPELIEISTASRHGLIEDVKEKTKTRCLIQ